MIGPVPLQRLTRFEKKPRTILSRRPFLLGFIVLMVLWFGWNIYKIVGINYGYNEVYLQKGQMAILDLWAWLWFLLVPLRFP